MYSGYTVEDVVESKQGGGNIHILSPRRLVAWAATTGMVVRKDTGGGLADCK
jgi:hypothetical protein